MQDTTHTIFHSAKRFFSGTMLSRVSGMLRDMAMAFAFGTQDAVAAFMVAFRFSHLLRRLFGEGALQTAFIPQFEEARQSDPQRAFQFFRDLMAMLAVWLSVVIVIAMAVLGGCLYWMDLSDGNREIIVLTLLMLPSLFFICLFGLNASLLQCERSYFLTGAAPVAFNLVWIAVVFLFWKMPITEAMKWLSIGVIVACLCQWLITVPKTYAILKKYPLTSPWRKGQFFSNDIAKFCKPLFLGILGVAASQINNAVDAVFARYADLEGPALLWYALRIQQLPLALFGIAIAGALLPPLSRALKNGDIPKYHHFLEYAIRGSFALMLPITAAILLLGDSCINVIYGHGDFSDHSTMGTTLCLWGYGIGLIPMTLVLILAPAYYAKSDYRTPTIASTVSVAVNIGLNAWLIAGLGLGAASVAVATSFSALVNVAILAVGLREDLMSVFSKNCLFNMAKILFATSLAVLAVFAVGSNFLPLLRGESLHFPHNLLDQISVLLLQSFAFGGIFGAICWLTRAEQRNRIRDLV